MPEYLAPGVYIEEVSYRAKSIEGVGTTTTGFVGPARYGPVDLEPDVITSLGEFERVYGDRQQLTFTDPDDSSEQKMHNYLWHAARAFFEEGGKRLYVSRIFNPIDAEDDDGHAKAWIPALGAGETEPADDSSWYKISARFPGQAGRMRVRLTLGLGQNILGSENGSPTVNSLLDSDIVLISNETVTSPPTAGTDAFYRARVELDANTGAPHWEFEPLESGSPSSNLLLSALNAADGDSVKVVSLTVTTLPADDSDLPPSVWDGLSLDPGHKRAGVPDSVFQKFAERPPNASDARRLPIIIERSEDEIVNGLEALQVLFDANSSLEAALANPDSTDAERSIDLLLDGGNDGQRPVATNYEGEILPDDSKTGLRALEDIEDISIVAAPGSTYGFEDDYGPNASTIINNLISHAERMRYRIAVLDSGNDQTIASVRAMRAKIDSKYAAFYYPWIRVLDPVTQQEIHLPPSGFVAGIYARNDTDRAVYKAPANEVVRLAIGFEKTLNKGQQEVLNPEGINCFRFFEGRGFRLWGARTISSDPEWKYVNLRRYFAYLERSIDKGTQWAVFEPNSEALWANVRLTIQDFLYNEWVSGALLGDKPEKAYFVRCDRSTMTQNDLDNGRLVCLIGVAASRPAEFVIFRIGQWTADRKG
jgi:phage tail sheath protein FI